MPYRCLGYNNDIISLQSRRGYDFIRLLLLQTKETFPFNIRPPVLTSLISNKFSLI